MFGTIVLLWLGIKNLICNKLMCLLDNLEKKGPPFYYLILVAYCLFNR